MTINGSGDVYCCVYGGNIYMQTAGAGNFISLSQTVRNWRSMAYNGSDVYCAVGGSSGARYIFKQTAGAGDFNALGGTSRDWRCGVGTPGGDIYFPVSNGDIYKRTGGIGAFVALSQTPRLWQAMAVNSAGDVFACVYNGDIYKQTGGTGDFVALGQSTENWFGITGLDNNVYACVYGGDIYKSTTESTGSIIPIIQNYIRMRKVA